MTGKVSLDLIVPPPPDEHEIILSIPAPPPPDDSAIAARMKKIESELIGLVGGLTELSEKVGQAIRTAIDYVIDAPALYRYTIDELESDEKTTIGKRIERLLRISLGLLPGEKLDIKLAGEDVDIKTTMRNQWMFSKNNYDHINLLIRYDEKLALYRLGLAYVTSVDLGAENRDEKRGLKKKPKANIHWLLLDSAYPPNFLGLLPPGTLKEILEEPSGMKRVAKLLETVNGKPIPRHAICSVGNQKDPMRRTRKNGGARDVLWSRNILVLSGTSVSDRSIAHAALWKTHGEGAQILKNDEMISFKKNDLRLTRELIKKYRLDHNLPS